MMGTTRPLYAEKPALTERQERSHFPAVSSAPVFLSLDRECFPPAPLFDRRRISTHLSSPESLYDPQASGMPEPSMAMASSVPAGLHLQYGLPGPYGGKGKR
ncbi:MAG: hypothetical protein Q8K00_17140 [Syntrophales bacterium]|nr:hypothetical protein [Syntrophales bacterium]